ncbi:glycosyltransferase involved in cell wall biosynthesis [Fontibacillus phaseoli]|uniref:Glycosyltransferase involved in cell wall biosynthesis n=1 Tax=Fontibacillus phaseoli TaxID=1416533 RepID=A0A369AYM1_9BACL|nr:bifunctional glycosyltransferase family 2/GtrA family protein [Fontibacillus phaseoli]RCX13286.1 glycosyltransferase involved in cell wall biosynthesis [Fontibacillus phaseoli]
MTILIPAYEPDERLLQLISQLRKKCLTNILIVDDGSGDAYRPIFNLAEAAGCTVLRHDTNMGKGRALKTGFRHLLQADTPEAVICADSDGQHLPSDILLVSEILMKEGTGVVLGSRRFTGKVPARSRFGNVVTRAVYAFTTGSKIFDTQTGLRGYFPSMLHWLCEIPGDRFEYEMNLLLAAQKEGISVREVFIDTVYLDENKSSHFRPLADSLRVYLPILLFSASSLISALLDFVLLLLLQHLGGNLLLSVAGARLCSSIINYAMNRNVVFRKPSGAAVSRSLPKYFTLVLLILLLNYGFMYAYHTAAGIPLILSKLLTEATLFVFSYWAQRKYVY